MQTDSPRGQEDVFEPPGIGGENHQANGESCNVENAFGSLKALATVATRVGSGSHQQASTVSETTAGPQRNTENFSPDPSQSGTNRFSDSMPDQMMYNHASPAMGNQASVFPNLSPSEFNNTCYQSDTNTTVPGALYHPWSFDTDPAFQGNTIPSGRGESWYNTVMNARNGYSAEGPVRNVHGSSPFLRTKNALTNLLTVLSTNENPEFLNPLSVLLYSLGCSYIRQDILFRGLMPQRRWNADGNVHEIFLHHSGVNEKISHLFSSQPVLEQALNYHFEAGLITRFVSADGSVAYSLSDHLHHQISQFFGNKDPDLFGLIFTTHIYPRDENLEPS